MTPVAKRGRTGANSCVFSTAFRPGFDDFKKLLKLNLDELNCNGGKIFPDKAFIAVKSGRKLGQLIKK